VNRPQLGLWSFNIKATLTWSPGAREWRQAVLIRVAIWRVSLLQTVGCTTLGYLKNGGNYAVSSSRDLCEAHHQSSLLRRRTLPEVSREVHFGMHRHLVVESRITKLDIQPEWEGLHVSIDEDCLPIMWCEDKGYSGRWLYSHGQAGRTKTWQTDGHILYPLPNKWRET
jgi:hypothetical protein